MRRGWGRGDLNDWKNALFSSISSFLAFLLSVMQEEEGGGRGDLNEWKKASSLFILVPLYMKRDCHPSLECPQNLSLFIGSP